MRHLDLADQLFSLQQHSLYQNKVLPSIPHYNELVQRYNNACGTDGKMEEGADSHTITYQEQDETSQSTTDGFMEDADVAEPPLKSVSYDQLFTENDNHSVEGLVASAPNLPAKVTQVRQTSKLVQENDAHRKSKM